MYVCFVSCKLFELALLYGGFYFDNVWLFLVFSYSSCLVTLVVCVCCVTMFLVGCELWSNGYTMKHYP